MQSPSAKYQYVAALVVNMLMIGWGITCGWPSPNIELLTSNRTPLSSGKISIDQASWVASLTCIGGLVGNIMFGFITNKFGRKLPLLLLSIPTTISWLLILFAKNVNHLYVSRTLNGIVGGGIFVIVPLYFSEISSDRVRGVLGSTWVLFANIGIILAFTFGNYFSFYMTPTFVIALTILYAVSFSFLPESPAFLMKQNKVSDAEKSVRFYHNISLKDGNCDAFQCEMNKLKSSFVSNGCISASDKQNSVSFVWLDLVTGTGRKAIIIGIVLVALNQFCGCFAMLNYTATIFKEAGSTMTPNVAAIVVGLIQVVGSYSATFLVDRTGRKFLYVVSSFGTAFGLITLGIYMMLKTWQFPVERFDWIPIASFSFVIFIANWAILTLPFLVISEIMPKQLKEFGISFCMTLLWSFAFIMIKCLPILNESLGFHGSMFAFAGVCVASALFIMLRMPETKGKSHDEIMNSL